MSSYPRVALRDALSDAAELIERLGSTTSKTKRDEFLAELVELVEAASVLAAAIGADASPEAELVAALARAQGAFPAIEKKHTAHVQPRDKPGYSYQYADLADVLAAVRPVLAEHGIAVTQRTRHIDGGKVLLATELRHAAGGILDSEVELGQSPGNPQQFGGALTYLRRYELVTLLGIAAEQDLDAQDVVPASTGRRSDVPSNIDTPAPLPDWAKAATRNRKAELRHALGVLLGDDTGVALAKAISDALGYVPDVVVGTVNGILNEFLKGTADELVGRRADERHRREQIAAAAQAEQARTAQDTAAERPDPPAPEPAADPPAPEDPPPAATLPATDDDLRALTDDELIAIVTDESQPSDRRESAHTILDQRDAAAPGELPPEAAAPGTVNVEDLPGDPARAIGTLKAAGCTCKDPLAIHGERITDDTCPIVGHGIPF